MSFNARAPVPNVYTKKGIKILVKIGHKSTFKIATTVAIIMALYQLPNMKSGHIYDMPIITRTLAIHIKRTFEITLTIKKMEWPLSLDIYQILVFDI